MPRIIQNQKGGKIIWGAEDWLSGINRENGANTGTIIGRTLNNSTASFNPYNKIGVAMPGPQPMDLTKMDKVDTPLVNIIVGGSSLSAYALSSGGKFHKIDPVSGAVTDDGTFPHTIASAVGEDIISYKIGTTEYCFYSWYDGTDGDVGRFNFSTTLDDDYMSTVPAGAAVLDKLFPLPMIVGADDILYIGSKNKVHAFDGQTGVSGTLSLGVFVLPTQYIITSFTFVEPNLMAIFAYKNTSGGNFYLSETKCFFWNYLDEDPVKVIDLEDNAVRAAFNFKGSIGCFTTGRKDLLTGGRATKIRLYDGQRFRIVEELTGDLPLNGGVQVYSNHILFNAGGIIYSYGQVKTDLRDTINKISVHGTESAALKNISQTLLLSSSNVAGQRLQKLTAGDFIIPATAQTIATFPPFPELKQGRIKMVTVVFSQPSGTIGSVLTSGTISAGISYVIYLYNPGDDFTNVGAASNATGITFTATGTTPTIWVNASQIIKIASRTCGLRIITDFDRTDNKVFSDSSSSDSKQVIPSSQLIQKFYQYQDGSQFPDEFQSIAIALNWNNGLLSGSDASTDAPRVKEVIVDYEFSDIESI